MRRRSTKPEPTWRRKQELKSLPRVRPAGKLPSLSLHRVQPNRQLSRRSIVESMHRIEFHRPAELAPLIGNVKFILKTTHNAPQGRPHGAPGNTSDAGSVAHPEVPRASAPTQ